jgi:hypothetical protein
MAAVQRRPPPLTVTWKRFFMFFPDDAVRVATLAEGSVAKISGFGLMA